jgi:hypothetical protein
LAATSISNHHAPKTGTRRRQNAKFQRQRGEGFPLAQLRDEGRNVGIGHRGMVAARQYSALGQKVREVATPRRRVFAGSMALRLGRVENRLNTPAQARGGFRLRLP